MYRRSLFFINVAIINLLLGLSWLNLTWATSATETGNKPEASKSYGRLPLFFEENRGQIADPVRFRAQGPGYQVFLTPTEAVFTFGQPSRTSEAVNSSSRPQAIKTGVHTTAPQAIRMSLVSANPNPTMQGQEMLSGKVSHLRGNDPKDWHTDISTYAKLHLEAVYAGIDLVYYGAQRQLEYDFVVAPGADPGLIRWVLAGVRTKLKPTLAENGDLLLQTDTEALRWRKPVLYQQIDGRRQPVEGRFTLHPSAHPTNTDADSAVQVGFQVAAYDRTQPLIIDPVLVYSTTFGGSNFEDPGRITIDDAGSAYMVGYTYSPDFPTVNGFSTSLKGEQDLFVAKIAPNGALIYATYLGGSACIYGEEVSCDYALGIAVDGAGNAYIAGTAYSADFPMINAFDATLGTSADAFMVKIDPIGEIVYSTFLGGNNGQEQATEFTIDSNGNAYIIGITYATDFPLVNAVDPNFAGGHDTFIAKLDPEGQAVYATYLGGTDSDVSFSVAVDQTGNAYIAGRTYSADFPTINAYDARLNGDQRSLDIFLVKLDIDGNAIYSTYLSGSQSDYIYNLAVDDGGNAYLAGTTDSFDFPTMNAFDQKLTGRKRFGNDAFIAKFDPSGQAIYVTYLGGSGDESVRGFAIDKAGRTYVTGETTSRDFPLFNAFDSRMKGRQRNVSEVFVAGFAADGQVIYSTYLGGRDFESVKNFKVDDIGNAYVVGQTASLDFPTHNAFDANLDFNSEWNSDPFLTKFDSTGQVIYSTYLSGNFGTKIDDFAVDKAGNAYVVDMINSTYFPLMNTFISCSGIGDGVLAKFNPQGQADYMTCLGINDAIGLTIKLDSANQVYVSGQFLVQWPNNYDVFLMKISD